MKGHAWALLKAAELRAKQGLPPTIEEPTVLAVLRALKRS